MMKKSKSELNNRAVNHTHKGNYKKAADIFESILSVNPDNLTVLYNYGYNFFEWGEKEKAVQVFDSIADTVRSSVLDSSEADQSVDPAEIITDCGVVCYDRGFYNEAEKYYLKAEKIEPENSFLLNHMGVLFFVTGRYGDAEIYFERAVEYDENYLDSWFNLADTYEMLEKTEKCESARKKYLELERRAHQD